MIAGLSANHLAALELPPTLHRLYVARDNDAAGRCAALRLAERTAASGLDVRHLIPLLADFNVDLECNGALAMIDRLMAQLDPADRVRFVLRERNPIYVTD